MDIQSIALNKGEQKKEQRTRMVYHRKKKTMKVKNIENIISVASAYLFIGMYEESRKAKYRKKKCQKGKYRTYKNTE